MACLQNKRVVFSGTFDSYTRRTAEQRAMNAGCLVTKAISKKTDILVCGEEPGSKLTKAENLGVEVLGQKEWEDILRKASSAPPSEDNDTDMDSDNPSPPPSLKSTKPKLKRHRTHNMSDEDEDADAISKPPLTKRRSLRLEDKEREAGTSDAPSAARKAGTSKPRQNPAVKAGVTRPKCRYGRKCYRKDPTHLKNFSHPLKAGAANADAEEEDNDDADVDVDVDDDDNNVLPVKVLADGETVDVAGGLHGALTYTLKNAGDIYSCTCTAWKMQRDATSVRTCRHLRAHLGDAFENQRIHFDPEVKPLPSRKQRHKQVAVLLAQKWTEAVDPKGWWLSEKLDGVRALWDGRSFYSRLGNEFISPAWFTKGLPSDISLDGELFGGRGKFQSTVSIVKTAESSRWKSIKFCVFDDPSLHKQRFEQRIAAINDIFEKNDVPYAYALEHEKCRGQEHLTAELERIEALGGEGVMLREPGSLYVGVRSKTLLKLKSFHDAEAVVIGYEQGKGRNASVVGALVCRMAKGTVFKVGSGLSDKDRRQPPKKGAIITYRFQELSNGGNPRFPTYVGVRLDLDKPSDAVIPPKPSDD